MKKPRPVKLRVGDRIEYRGTPMTKIIDSIKRGPSMLPGDVGVVVEVRPPTPPSGHTFDGMLDRGRDGRATVHFVNGYPDLSVTQDVLESGRFLKLEPRSLAEQRLINAAINARRGGEQHGRPEGPYTFGLMELERFGGPACGSAGSIARRWPATGLEVEGYRLTPQIPKRGKRGATKIEVTRLPPSIIVKFNDLDGLTCAWAKGPRSRREEIRKLALEHLNTYCARAERDFTTRNPMNYVEVIEDLDVEISSVEITAEGRVT